MLVGSIVTRLPGPRMAPSPEIAPGGSMVSDRSYTGFSKVVLAHCARAAATTARRFSATAAHTTQRKRQSTPATTPATTPASDVPGLPLLGSAVPRGVCGCGLVTVACTVWLGPPFVSVVSAAAPAKPAEGVCTARCMCAAVTFAKSAKGVAPPTVGSTGAAVAAIAPARAAVAVAVEVVDVDVVGAAGVGPTHTCAVLLNVDDGAVCCTTNVAECGVAECGVAGVVSGGCPAPPVPSEREQRYMLPSGAAATSTPNNSPRL